MLLVDQAGTRARRQWQRLVDCAAYAAITLLFLLCISGLAAWIESTKEPIVRVYYMFELVFVVMFVLALHNRYTRHKPLIQRLDVAQFETKLREIWLRSAAELNPARDQVDISVGKLPEPAPEPEPEVRRGHTVLLNGLAAQQAE